MEFIDHLLQEQMQFGIAGYSRHQGSISSMNCFPIDSAKFGVIESVVDCLPNYFEGFPAPVAINLLNLKLWKFSRCLLRLRR